MKSAAETIFRTLLDNDVRFVVIGALAATMQGSYLRTEDIDICADRATDNLERLATSLNELEAFEWDPYKAEPIERTFTAEMLSVDKFWLFVMGGYRFDVVFNPAGSSGYAELAERATVVDLEGRRLLVASIEDLIRSKEELDRDKDKDQLRVLHRLLEEQE
jgi:predicted nucleotidyltransferase